MERNVTNTSYYIALVDTETNNVEIRTNTKTAREYFKGIKEDKHLVFKLKNTNIDSAFAELVAYLNTDKEVPTEYTLIRKRNKSHMPAVMPFEL
jgi:hypothetical protein